MSFRPLFLSTLVVTVAVIGIRCISSLLAESLTSTVGNPGTVDFVQYWSAFHLLIDGRNPYDGAEMHTLQARVGQLPYFTTLMWNPPWTPLVLAPIVSLPFPAAVIGWFLSSIACLTWLALQIPVALGLKSPPPLICGLSVILFYPVHENLVLGQLSILLTTILVLVLCCRRFHRYFLGGFLAALLSMKPHLFFLVVVPVCLTLLKAPLRVTITSCAGFALGLLILVAATWGAAPGAPGWWLGSFSHSPGGPGAVSTAEWKTATIITTLRELLLRPTGEVPTWPILAVPLIAFIGTAGLFMRSRRPVQWSMVLPPLLCLSLLLGPYGWLYDQTVLVLCQFDVVTRWWWNRADTRLGLGVCGLIAIQFAAFSLGSITTTSQDDFTWLPAAVLAVWYLAGTYRVGVSLSAAAHPAGDRERPPLKERRAKRGAHNPSW